mmetsp:Transcript_100388/g.287256  ORF Transcript_100388/g.287256 Transcript_100388/m.287256 type:complete len:212 (+) Transcript_100388:2430-3065(+)
MGRRRCGRRFERPLGVSGGCCVLHVRRGACAVALQPLSCRDVLPRIGVELGEGCVGVDLVQELERGQIVRLCRVMQRTPGRVAIQLLVGPVLQQKLDNVHVARAHRGDQRRPFRLWRPPSQRQLLLCLVYVNVHPQALLLHGLHHGFERARLGFGFDGLDQFEGSFPHLFAALRQFNSLLDLLLLFLLALVLLGPHCLAHHQARVRQAPRL